MLFITKKNPTTPTNYWTIIYSRPVTITGKQRLVIVDYTFAHTFAAANLSVRPGDSSVISHWLN